MARNLLRPPLAWLAIGLVLGGVLVACWPRQTLQAFTSDRNDKFAMTTAILAPDKEAVFVLDFLTGQLSGFALDRVSERFMVKYFRNVAQDFEVDVNKPARYSIVSGLAPRPNRAGESWAASYIYVGELSSGRVNIYAIPYRQTNRPVPAPVGLILIGGHQFSEPRPTE